MGWKRGKGGRLKTNLSGRSWAIGKDGLNLIFPEVKLYYSRSSGPLSFLIVSPPVLCLSTKLHLIFLLPMRQCRLSFLSQSPSLLGCLLSELASRP